MIVNILDFFVVLGVLVVLLGTWGWLALKHNPHLDDPYETEGSDDHV